MSSRRRNRSNDGFDESDLFSDLEFDLEAFIDSMVDSRARHKLIHSHRRRRTSRQRVDDWADTQWLRNRLQDWDDWDENDEIG